MQTKPSNLKENLVKGKMTKRPQDIEGVAGRRIMLKRLLMRRWLSTALLFSKKNELHFVVLYTNEAYRRKVNVMFPM